MKSVKLNESGSAVRKLQFYLNLSKNYNLLETGVFDEKTNDAVKSFQEAQNLGVDGIVGKNTWKSIFKSVYKDNFFVNQITNQFLNANEYYADVFSKNAIYLHHTAGNFNPKSTLRWWEIDHYDSGATRHIGTPFVIGRKSSMKEVENNDFDGKTYRAFNEINWAHHLGIKGGKSSNYKLDKSTIGLEICSFGWLYKDAKGFYYQANKAKNTKKVYLNDEGVHQLEDKWRGQLYFEKYTEKQLEETKRLILNLAFLFDINLPNREYDKKWFEIQQEAKDGKLGLWTHVNVRRDKTDCFPQPELIEMLNTLHEEQKTFLPELKNKKVEFIQPIRATEVISEIKIGLDDKPKNTENILSDDEPVSVGEVTTEIERGFVEKSINNNQGNNYEMKDMFRSNDLLEE